MAKISFEEHRKERVTDLMNKFFEYHKKYSDAVGNGGRFVDVHEWQILAANVIHDVDEEDLLYLAKEEYPWEVNMINEYLEIYEEIKSGVRI